MHYSILYRGPLSSCNYGCDYCPFAKRRENYEQLAGDREDLSRFIDRIEREANDQTEFSVLFTPWGEALIRKWYQLALVRLTQMPHVHKAAVQTNLSCTLGWIEKCDLSKLGLWCTFHPSQTTQEQFLNQCRILNRLGVRYSVGIVGTKENIAAAQTLRDALDPGVYLWINAYKRINDYYAQEELDALTAIDPLFPLNNTRHPSEGKSCRTGQSVFSVFGDGNMYRCHFIKAPIGNFYRDDWRQSLEPAPCTNSTCGCHIGYVHMPELKLDDVFGAGVLERVPCQPVHQVSINGLYSAGSSKPATQASAS